MIRKSSSTKELFRLFTEWNASSFHYNTQPYNLLFILKALCMNKVNK